MEKEKKKISLANKILIGMILGAITGLIVGPSISAISFIGDIFLRLLRMAVVPLIFANVVLAVAGMGDLTRLGKIGIRLIILFLVTTFISGSIGLMVAMVIRPGVGFVMGEASEVAEAVAPTFQSTLLAFFPTNILESFATGNMLQVITFAIFSGIAILLLSEDDQKKMLDAFGLVSRYIMSVLKFCMGFTPYGVFALMADTTGTYGASIFGPLGKFIVVIYVGLILHAILAYGGIYLASTGKNPFTFYKKIAPVWTTSLATCSTAATMPVSIRVCNEELNLKKDISGFVIPVGATMNMDGNGLWFGAVAVFVSQVMGLDMSMYEMFMAVFTGVLMTLGSPGIPGGIFVATTIFLTSLGLPIEFVGLLGGIFRIMDMGITTINVVGSVVVAAVLDAIEKKSDKKEASAVN